MDGAPDAAFVDVDVRMPADLFIDLETHAVAHGYGNVDEAVSDALRRQ